MTVLSFIVIISLLVNLFDPVDKMGDSVLESVDFEIILSKKKVLINVNILLCFFKQIFLILEVSETI